MMAAQQGQQDQLHVPPRPLLMNRRTFSFFGAFMSFGFNCVLMPVTTRGGWGGCMVGELMVTQISAGLYAHQAPDHRLITPEDPT